MEPTYRPSKRTRRQQHGFRARMQSNTGRKILARRRKAGRWRLLPKGVEIKFERQTPFQHTPRPQTGKQKKKLAAKGHGYHVLQQNARSENTQP